MKQSLTSNRIDNRQAAAPGREPEARVHVMPRGVDAAAEYIEGIFRTHFVPEMRQFFAGRIRKLIQKRGRIIALPDDEREKLGKAQLCLDGWETAGQSSAAAFSSE
jgi:alkanesulfonate monooxygenase SsuD/methylene tetrahydromethanopterin reductase-like flavin-dependent oxidoreductase (luciferase family)